MVYGECSNSIFSEIKPDTKQCVGLHFRFVFSCRITPLLVIPSVMYSTRHVCIVRPLFAIENLDLVSLYSCNTSFFFFFFLNCSVSGLLRFKELQGILKSHTIGIIDYPEILLNYLHFCSKILGNLYQFQYKKELRIPGSKPNNEIKKWCWPDKRSTHCKFEI